MGSSTRLFACMYRCSSGGGIAQLWYAGRETRVDHFLPPSLPSDRGKEGGRGERDEGCSMGMDKVVLSRFALSVFFDT